MQKFTTHRGIAAPLLRENVNTDIVIRIERLFSTISRGELGRYCFEAWRFRPDGSENPDFPLNKQPYRRATILLAAANFGCGSSREGAVWALMGMGYRCVIAPSFGDIFFNNCLQNGMLPVRMDIKRIEAIAGQVEADPEQNHVTVDLIDNVVIAPDGTRAAFQIPALRREALLDGLSDIELTPKREPDIAAFQARDTVKRPWIYRLPTI